MNTPTKRLLLTDSEKDVLNRFTTAVLTPGIQLTLFRSTVSQAGDGNGAVAIEIVREAIDDLEQHMNKNGLFDWAAAAPSLKLLVDDSQLSGVFAGDVIPSKESVQVCLNGFFDMIRVHP